MDSSRKKERTFVLGLFHRRECVVPTWRGWLALAGSLAILFAVVVRGAYGFLAVNDPVMGGYLVVEGWSPDFTVAQAVIEYRRHPYKGVLVTGGPIELGSPLIKHKNYAELGTAILLRMGIKPEEVSTIPVEPAIRDRTYASALAVKRWLRERGATKAKINIMGNGAHTRRTRLLYEKAFRDESRIGIASGTEENFDPNRWWTSSQGFRTVVDEMIAYAYARLLFRPKDEQPVPQPDTTKKS